MGGLNHTDAATCAAEETGPAILPQKAKKSHPTPLAGSANQQR